MVSKHLKWVCIVAALALSGCGGGSAENSDMLGSATATAGTELSATDTQAERESEVFHEAKGVPVVAEEKLAATGGTPQREGMRKVEALNTASPTSALIDLGAPAPAATTEMRSRNALRSSGANNLMLPKAYQIGFGRPVPAMSTSAATAAALRWEPTAVGGYRGSIPFRSEGARQLRVGMLVQQLPDNALVRVQGENDTQALELDGAFINRALASNRQADGNSEATQTYWLPGTNGETATLEIELAAGTDPSMVQIALPKIAHGSETAVSMANDLLQAKSACPGVTPDATCSLPTSANAINASASYDFVIGGDTFACSGTLIADKAGSPANYFLTAHHCVNTQTHASSVNVHWFNRSSTCPDGGPLNPGSTQSDVTGATYLFGQSIISGSISNPTGTDTSLLRLTGTPPVGAYKAGWTIDRQPISNTTLTSIHHPAPAFTPTATWARRSDGRIAAYGSALIPNQGGALVYFDTDARLPLYMINWSTGITEQGSSGSALFRNADTTNPQVVGQLYGGSSSCTAPTNPDIYGRFDIGYEDGMINWLNPGYRMVFRMFNTQAGVHFYTANVSERNTIRQNMPTYLYEGSAFTVRSSSDTGLSPVFRFYNRRTGTHFYTISASERDLVMTYPTYSYEGIAWYARSVSSPAAGTIAIYRFYLPSQGTHFYTASASERDSVIANLSHIYTYEGVAYRAWPRE